MKHWKWLVLGLAPAAIGALVFACSESTTEPLDEPPAAVAGPDLDVAMRATVTLDGRASSDPEGQQLTFAWTQLRGPDVTAGAGTLTGETVSFTAPDRVTTLLFQLVVSDATHDSPPDTVQVNVMENPAHAFFVSPGGSDLATGTRAAPLRSLQEAVKRAAAGGAGADVYAAAGTYSGRLELASGVSVYGGFESQRWTRWSAADTTRLLADDSIAVLGDEVADLVLDGLAILAANATEWSTSSYGLLLRGSQRVSVMHSSIRAGNGAPGLDGVRGTDGAHGLAGGPGLIGHCDAMVTASGGAGGLSTVALGGGGGKGGNGSENGRAGENGEGIGGGAGGGGGAAGVTSSIFVRPTGSPGAHGQNGLPGNDGEHGTGGADFGTFGGLGFVPAPGAPGVAGQRGYGGGGGGGGGGQSGPGVENGTGNGGGGGGGGGGPGTGGEGGGGGGGSFGIMLVESTDITVSNTVVSTGTGGPGGAGGASGLGGNGGAGGAGYVHCTDEVGRGGNGGNGGKGGTGGAGGGGGGGPSIGLAADTLSSFDLQAATIHVGEGGEGGEGPANPGEPGLAADTFPKDEDPGLDIGG